MKTKSSRWIVMARLALSSVCIFLVGCSTSSRPKSAEIQTVPVLQDIQTAWTANIGNVNFPLVVSVRDDRVALANGQGEVVLLDAVTGKDIWRLKLNQAISAGVGSDGQQLAVVTRNNELITMQDGKVQWRKSLPAQSFTPPLVAGARVFVLTADRTVIAFDGVTGRQLWTQQRSNDPLILKQAGVLLAFKNTLIVGLSGRLLGLNPNTGAIRWDAGIATPRGTNDIERLVDLVAPFDRMGDMVCVRAFQASVGCVNAERGQSIWTRPSVGEIGVSGDQKVLIDTLSNGVVQAWNRATGERLWTNDQLKYRTLSAPLVTPRGVLLADHSGWLYLISLTDGVLLNRIKLDANELVTAPVFAGGRYIVVTREGRVTGFQMP